MGCEVKKNQEQHNKVMVEERVLPSPYAYTIWACGHKKNWKQLREAQ